MRYIDVYPHCVKCPVHKYCGTAISSIRLCNSYDLNFKDNDDDNSGV